MRQETVVWTYDGRLSRLNILVLVLDFSKYVAHHAENCRLLTYSLHMLILYRATYYHFVPNYKYVLYQY